jgi:single-strand DNA-binding protein
MAIANISIAVNKRQKVNNEWKDKASFFDCTYFGKGAESVSQYLVKGQQVSIQGSLDQQSWESNGQKHSKVVIIVNSLGLLGSQKQGSNNQNSGQNYQNQGNINTKPIYNQQNTVENFEDDIPF